MHGRETVNTALSWKNNQKNFSASTWKNSGVDCQNE